MMAYCTHHQPIVTHGPCPECGLPVRRVYCGRVGVVLALAEGQRCGECFSTTHRVHDEDTCGAFASISDHEGMPCVLSIGHAGEHQPPEDP